MSYAAFAVAVVAALISLVSLRFAHLADQRAERAERQAAAAGRVSVLERIGSIMREASTTAAATATDPMANSRLKATRARLVAALDEAGVDLPNCREYARNVDANALPAAEEELEREIAAERG